MCTDNYFQLHLANVINLLKRKELNERLAHLTLFVYYHILI